MQHFLANNSHTARVNKTSQDTRYNLKSQDGQRMFRFTGGLERRENKEAQEDSADQLKEIEEIGSYRMSDELAPRMRMKWKSPYEIDAMRKIESKDTSTIGNNNIDLLSYTIPEI